MNIVRVNWPRAHRVISSIYPPIDLFEDTSDPRDWELLASLESKTNPRIHEEIGNLALVPPDRRVGGPGASIVMAPFTHISPKNTGRFNDGTFGTYYAANSLETALAEVIHHRTNIYFASGEKPGWLGQFREYVGAIDQQFEDVDTHGDKDNILSLNDYSASQLLARERRAAGSNGFRYTSVRYDGGLCIAAFWPDIVQIPVQAGHFAFHFNGKKIDMYRDETTSTVFEVTWNGQA